jgi:hypothetical protein
MLSVSRLYHLHGCPIAGRDAAELVLDRSTAPDVDRGVSRRPEREPETAAIRLLALGSVLGADLVDVHSVAVLAEAYGTTVEHIEAAIFDAEPAAVATAADTICGRVVVPLTGILLAFTSAGSVMVSLPAGRRGRRTHRTPAAAPLRSLLATALVRS